MASIPLEDQVKALQKQLKDVKGAYTKSRQELSTTKAEAAVRQSFTFDSGISDADLEALKVSDPEAWKTKLADIDASKDLALSKALKEAGVKAAEDIRVEILSDALKVISIDMDTLKSEVPAKYLKQYEDGKIDEQDLAGYAKVFMSATKVLSSPTTPDGIDFSTVAGGIVPGDEGADINADPNDSIV